jgi:hypothetical protein
MGQVGRVVRRLFDSEEGPRDRFITRWLFLRAVGLIYFSAFLSLVFQIRGLIGPRGLLPATEYLQAVHHSIGLSRGLWFAPTVFWISAGTHMLVTCCWIGMLASLLLVASFWPRGMLVVCFVCFISFVSAAQDFSGYQSDGMLLEAGFISLFFAPRGLWPGLGIYSRPSRGSLFLLQWEWFRIYFESGMAKIAGGDPEWRNFTAMDEYYQNGPLPTWIGWYVQHLPHGFHAFAAGATLVLELGLVWMLFLPRRWRLLCFFIVTPWELGVILTANYTFLNYLVLVLGFLLLDDRFCARLLPEKWSPALSLAPKDPADVPADSPNSRGQRTQSKFHIAKFTFGAVVLSWVFYVATVQMLSMFSTIPFPTSPVVALEPFRIANRYGLFGVMTRGRYEIEFQGSDDGENWTAYPFRFKPQDVMKAPPIYAPYQSRFDWNLWFASLGTWREYPIVPATEVSLLANDADVLSLFAGNPFANHPPKQVRAVLWQYWFTTLAEKRQTGRWWRREYVGLYAPTIELGTDGRIHAVEVPAALPPRRD